MTKKIKSLDDMTEAEVMALTTEEYKEAEDLHLKKARKEAEKREQIAHEENTTIIEDEEQLREKLSEMSNEELKKVMDDGSGYNPLNTVLNKIIEEKSKEGIRTRCPDTKDHIHHFFPSLNLGLSQAYKCEDCNKIILVPNGINLFQKVRYKG